MSGDSSINQLLIHKVINNDLSCFRGGNGAGETPEGPRRPEEHVDQKSQDKRQAELEPRLGWKEGPWVKEEGRQSDSCLNEVTGNCLASGCYLCRTSE